MTRLSIPNRANYKIWAKLSNGADKVYLIEYQTQLLILKMMDQSKHGVTNPNEIDIGSRVLHPNIVKIETLLARTLKGSNPSLGASMKRYDLNLFDLIQAGRITMSQRIQIIRKLFAVVDLLHQQGIFHFDIKPENVVMDGLEPKLLDFGFCKQMSSRQSTFTTRQSFMTTAYAAPEILKSDIDKTYGAHTDVWALAMTAIYVLAGRTIYSGLRGSAADNWSYVVTHFRTDQQRHSILNQLCGHCKDQGLIKTLVAMTSFSISGRPQLNTIERETISPLIMLRPKREYDLTGLESELWYLVTFFIREGYYSINSLYLAVDIFYRAAWLAGSAAHAEHIRKYIAVSCIWIAINCDRVYNELTFRTIMRYYQVSDIKYTDITIDAVLANALFGLIRPPFLLDSLTSLKAYKEAVVSHLIQPAVYQSLDPDLGEKKSSGWAGGSSVTVDSIWSLSEWEKIDNFVDKK